MTHSFEITGISFGTTSERVRIEALTLLCGVNWPIASTILRYCVREHYPILDVRALWSLDIETSPYRARSPGSPSNMNVPRLVNMDSNQEPIG
jgi:hypothetical protein